MKLAELISNLTSSERFKAMYEELGLNEESEALLIYLKEELDIEADITIFEIEETDDVLLFQKDGIQYIQLFPIAHVIDLIEFDLDLKDKGYSNIEIAQKLVDYRKNDA